MARMEGPKLDIRNLASKAALFQDRIRGVQESLPRPGFDWYPYDSIGNVFLLADLLTGERQFLLDLIGDGPVLDIGCGDGHISFFLGVARLHRYLRWITLERITTRCKVSGP